MWIYKDVRFWIEPFLIGKQIEDLFLGCFLVLLGEKYSLDVWQDSTLGDGDSRQKLVQFLVISDSQLKMSWYDSCLLVVPGSVTSQLQDFGAQIFQDSSQVHRCTWSDSVSIVTFSKESVDTSNRELKSSSEWSGLCLGLGLSTFTTSRHNDLQEVLRTKHEVRCIVVQ